MKNVKKEIKKNLNFLGILLIVKQNVTLTLGQQHQLGNVLYHASP